jgi:hypothetical protein
MKRFAVSAVMGSLKSNTLCWRSAYGSIGARTILPPAHSDVIHRDPAAASSLVSPRSVHPERNNSRSSQNRRHPGLSTTWSRVNRSKLSKIVRPRGRDQSFCPPPDLRHVFAVVEFPLLATHSADK